MQRMEEIKHTILAQVLDQSARARCKSYHITLFFGITFWQHYRIDIIDICDI